MLIIQKQNVSLSPKVIGKKVRFTINSQIIENSTQVFRRNNGNEIRRNNLHKKGNISKDTEYWNYVKER